MKRKLSIIILTAMLAGLPSCGDAQAETPDTLAPDIDSVTSVEETSDPRYAIKEQLPDKNYGDYSVRILMRNSTSPD